MAQPLAKPKFRRIVTKHDASGKATIWIDADATNHKFPNEKITSTLMWSTDCTPTRLLSDEDEGDRILGSAPPPCGSRFTMMEFQPGNEATLHRTDTVDYVICLSGEIDMFLDDFAVYHAASWGGPHSAGHKPRLGEPQR